VILKAAEETPASALGVLQCLLDAGLPKEVAQAVFGVPDEVSRHLLASPVIRKLSFTGSTVIGKHLSKLAADNCIRTTMELGGHGPVLVFGDADIDRALDTMVTSKYRNAGQVCVSPTRFIVEESVFDRFRDGFVERVKAIRVGNGLDEGAQMGPMANARRPEAMERLIGDATARGAKLLAAASAWAMPGSSMRRRCCPKSARCRGSQRGAVRPGGAAQPVPGRGGHDRGGEPPALWPGRLCLDAGRQAPAARGARDRKRHGGHQHDHDRWRGCAVRRGQVVGPRGGGRPGRRDGLPGHQGGPRRLTGQRNVMAGQSFGNMGNLAERTVFRFPQRECHAAIAPPCPVPARAVADSVSARAAGPAQNDHQVWGVVQGTVDLGGRATSAFDVQYRVTDGASRQGQVLIRPAIGVYLNKTTAAYLGYAFVTTDPLGGTPTDEHRVFEQLTFRIAGDGKGPTLTARTRLEQRFVEGWTGHTGWRLRQQVRGTLPLGDRGVALVSTLEPFVSFNTTGWGQRAGFDQVRAFAGVSLPVARGSPSNPATWGNTSPAIASRTA
jgi:hypothetical protein